ncbi:MAG: hypothetical protein CME06_07970 [Gemmatimonadetes bacterium]|nr:hypothetical protein [Gemmatimonadota bacterium]
MLPARLRLGTSGYAYKDWVGPFYPPGVPQGEWLSFYAQRFDTVEINSTYYRVGPKSSYAAMRAKVGDEFVFSVKAPGDVTHVRREDPVPILSEFFNAIAPLGRGPVLLQFPFSFHYTATNRRYLSRSLEAFDTRAAVVEVRHDSWVRASVTEGLSRRGVALASVDLPALPGLPPREAIVTANPGYLRLHGRNTERWWEHDNAWQRYDYRYRSDELKEWVPRIRRMLQEAEDVFVYANNHFQGQAVEAIELIESMLGDD